MTKKNWALPAIAAAIVVAIVLAFYVTYTAESQGPVSRRQARVDQGVLERLPSTSETLKGRSDIPWYLPEPPSASSASAPKDNTSQEDPTGTRQEAPKPQVDGFADSYVSIEDATDLENYIDSQQRLLSKLAERQHDDLVTASVTLKEPIRGDQIDELVKRYNLDIEFFEFEATQNVHGGYSTAVVEDLAALQQRLDVSDPGVKALGMTYFIVRARADHLLGLQSHPTVLLVDVGNVTELHKLQAQGKSPVFIPPPSLYYDYINLR